MKPKAKFEQIALWVVATSRPDLTMLLRKDNLTDAEKTTLRNAGVNVDVPYTKGMILSIRPALSSLDQMSVVFHQAIADQTIDELTLRQTELAAQKRSAQVEVDIQNGLIALRQARVQYDAAVKNRQLQQQLVAAEQKKFDLGASIPTNVVQVQRDQATSQSSELAALTTYIRARVTLDKTLGRTLETNHITLENARSGRLQ